MAAGNRTLRRRRPDRPRLLAHRILGAVTQQDAYANLETARVLSDAGLDPRDAGFVTELVSGTCRLLGTYDRILAAASGRDSFDPALADALRLGTHQLLSMRVGHHAAISTTVDLAAATVGEKVAGLTNAVLRKVAARDLDGWVDHLARDEDALGRLALRTHHPRWIAQAYVDLLGDEADEALSANNVPPVPTLVVRPGLAEVSELDGEPTSRSPFGARRPGNPGDLPAVREGRAGVQDEGSQLVALALAESDAPEGPWLDLCAGPGGKAALLAGLAMQQGSTLLASELQPHRAELVAQALRAYDGPHRPEAIAADGTVCQATHATSGATAFLGISAPGEAALAEQLAAAGSGSPLGSTGVDAHGEPDQLQVFRGERRITGECDPSFNPDSLRALLETAIANGA